MRESPAAASSRPVDVHLMQSGYVRQERGQSSPPLRAVRMSGASFFPCSLAVLARPSQPFRPPTPCQWVTTRGGVQWEHLAEWCAIFSTSERAPSHHQTKSTLSVAVFGGCGRPGSTTHIEERGGG